ncbi:MAG: DUF1573 domain-containing protein [Planctomycetales bacterium]|nr:DUF1573 domain-containing protein [Planctomycetales bacterium]
MICWVAASTFVGQKRAIIRQVRAVRQTQPVLARYSACFVLAASTVVCFLGCGRQSVAIDDPGDATSVEVWQLASTAKRPAGTKDREITRDLGVVSIGHESVERFEIHNDSSSPWTLKTIHVNCSCTTTKITANIFPPEHSESVYVRYKAGSRSSNEKRSVIVEFEERDAPQVRLSITAQVRKVMSVDPREVVVSPVANVQPTVEKDVRLYNFGPLPWQSVTAKPSVDWLNVVVTQVRDDVDAPVAGEPSQLWNVHLAVDATELSIGSYSAVVNFGCSEDANCQEMLLVQMNVGSPVNVIPSSLYFGECAAVSKTVRSVRMICHPEFAHVDMSACQTRSALADALQITWEHPSESVWILNAELRVNERNGELVDEVLEVMPPDDRLDTLRIPVQAIVESKFSSTAAIQVGS